MAGSDPLSGASLVGRALGHYRVLALVGRGGMGEVYRARDETLGRDVALKRLPPEFAQDEGRLRRFEREARALASLNHPHVATLYGLEEIEGTLLIAMELVEGEALDERLVRGPLPVREALRIARQVAEGLEAAHARGIVHRDLKPANLKLAADGRVKVLDFGLARPFGPEPSGDGATHTAETAEALTRGVVVGTAAYMSPEQARGLAVDRRTDIFSFGATVYELLTARRAFPGKTASDALALVLDREPDWGALPADTPTPVRRLLQRCLRKGVDERLHDIADARLELEDALHDSQEGLPASGGTQASARVLARTRRSLVWLVVGLLLGGAVSTTVFLATRRPPAQRRTLRFSVPLPEGWVFRGVGFSGSPLALSADGWEIVFVAWKDKKIQLFRQELGAGNAQSIPDTEGARAPFLSHDGRQLGYAIRREVRLRPTASDPDAGPEPARSISLPIANVDVAFFGGDFSPKGDPLYIGECSRGIRSISLAASGPAKSVVTEVLSEPDKAGVGMHQFPQALPDGKHLLYTWWNPPESEIRLLDLATGERRTLLTNATAGRYVPSGHILYAWEGNLYAAAFDLRRLATSGRPVRVLEGVRTELVRGAAYFAVSEEGTLAYVPGGVIPNAALPTWVSRDGTRARVLSESPAWGFSLSPDGGRIEFVRGMGEIWVYETQRGVWRRLTDERGTANWAQWTPDGRSLIFGFGEWVRKGSEPAAAPHNLYRRLADASQPPERLTTSPNRQSPMAISPDGRLLAFVEDTTPADEGGGGLDIWMLPLEGGRAPRPWLATRSGETHPAFSPDGRSVAYASRESGDWHVMVRPLEGQSPVEQVSIETGWEPLWSKDGREILFRSVDGKRIFAASFEPGPRPRVGRPHVVAEGNFFGGGTLGRTWALAPDDSRFLLWEMGDPATAPPVPYFNVVLNFLGDVERKLAARATP